MEDEQGLLAFAMAIYGLVVFPKVLGHVEVSVIDFFDQVTRSINPAPSILAETFRSLNFCRRKGEGRFIGCAQLLTIWIKSHFECKESKFRKLYLSVSCPILEFCESEWPDYKRKEEWVARLRRLMSIEVTWRAPWMPRMQVMYKCGDKPWVPLMGPWGAISYAPIMVRRQFGSEQFVPMTHQLDQLEFTYGEPETLKRIEEIAQDWKKTCRVDQGRVTDEVTTGYHTWHDQRVKNVIHPPKNPSKHPVNPEPQDVLLESELTRKRLEKEMMNMKRRHEDELEEVKKETARKVRVALKERDEWQSKFEEVSVANSSLLARIQELQSANNALQHEVRRQGQTIQELKNDCDMLETAMEGHKAQARVMADKTEELRREILPKDELSERLINHLKMVRDQYDKNKIPEKQILHRYNTRARSKIMGDEHSERMDKIEKKQEEIMGQLSKILELISTDKGKKATGSSGTPEDVQQTETNTDPVYPPGFTPPPARNVSIPMPSVGQYPFFRMPIGPPPTYAQQRPIGGASPSDPISVPDLDDPKEQEKLKCGSVESKDNPDTHKKFDLFEERLRMVEGMGMYCSMDAIELCLVPDVVIPPKFKVPDFEKYDGTKCPVTHITMYCRRMAAYAHDDKLLIHCFQDSLTGAAAKWYVQLDRNRIHTWKNLARAFVAQYKHITDMASDRLSLQNMEKKTTESFKEYAQRWRNVASQVQPPLTEKETTVMFVNTLRAPYYERLVGSATKNFVDMVISGEMIETAIKQGKIEGAVDRCQGSAAGTRGRRAERRNREGERRSRGTSRREYQLQIGAKDLLPAQEEEELSGGIEKERGGAAVPADEKGGRARSG
ncbi:Uncharacterized protein TCM_010930 [Theobroma cacao]|uniref:Uncharacterized protein n=1 Tax=Theobroma cacao TaxID=3641 RepID=A0A061E8N3_THECC|nr:Uncharacterized protein TCM_010930 [Theobroma cacao]